MRFLIGLTVDVADHDVDLLINSETTTEDAEAKFFQSIRDRFDGTAIKISEIRIMQMQEMSGK